MDFSFTSEQDMLRDTVAKLVSQQYDFDTRRKVAKSDAGWRPEMWAQFAELGLLGASFTEAEGGFGSGPIEAMIISEEFGKGLVIEPYLQTVVIGGNFFRHGGTDAQKEEHIAGIIGGETRIAFAYSEPKSRFDLNDVSTTAKKDGAGYVLNGHKAVVLGAPFATHLIVTARTSGGQRDAKGVSVFLVAKDAKGVTTRDYPTVDGLRASEVHFENVAVGADALIGAADNGLPLVEKVIDNAIAALCAEAVGCFKVLNEATISYSKQRKQFGQPIGNFQVLQHRMVDMFMAAEQATSMTYMLTLKLDEADKARKMAASAAKVQVGKAGKLVSQDAVQIHGGMGMTDELNVGHFFKRVTMIESQFGNTDWHLRRYTELSAG
ncbi:MAG: pimeloyl-CoA dehydrogenase small subunit [Rhodobacterales bacterium 12-64-8]|nr:MAG: pimeloyl-CoA dehydrogenase small subunit [Rhodobacterales bacterium 12-64-8]OYX49206.1 MAG: pimeloyl-CoA dehydrogenase small subunit [Alphaproteobacteria bacterium 32-64-14]